MTVDPKPTENQIAIAISRLLDIDIDVRSLFSPGAELTGEYRIPKVCKYHDVLKDREWYFDADDCRIYYHTSGTINSPKWIIVPRPAKPSEADLAAAISKFVGQVYRKKFQHGAELTGEFREVRATDGEEWFFENGSLFFHSGGTPDKHWIIRPKTAPQQSPKPSEAWLRQYNCIATDIYEIPVKDKTTLYFWMEGIAPQQYSSTEFQEFRWRVLPKPPTYVPWTLETFPGTVMVRSKGNTKRAWTIIGMGPIGGIDGVTMGGFGHQTTEKVANSYVEPLPMMIYKVSFEQLFKDYTTMDGSPCGTLQK